MAYLPSVWLIFMVNVGKYTSPMDPMGLSGFPTKHGIWPSPQNIRSALTPWHLHQVSPEVSVDSAHEWYINVGSTQLINAAQGVGRVFCFEIRYLVSWWGFGEKVERFVFFFQNSTYLFFICKMKRKRLVPWVASSRTCVPYMYVYIFLYTYNIQILRRRTRTCMPRMCSFLETPWIVGLGCYSFSTWVAGECW